MGIASQARRRGPGISALLAAVTLLCAAGATLPSAAWALSAPTVSSIEPNEVGSAGGFVVHIHGTHFEEVTGVKYGTVPATKIITAGTPTKGQCKVIATTELECSTPFHEHGKVNVIVSNSAGESTSTPADEITFLFEVYKNEIVVGSARVPAFGFGQLEIESPQIQETFECASLGDGVAWDEGTPRTGHAEILGWSASGHFPTAEHTELSARCRFIYHGTEENQPTAPAVWLTAEPPLRYAVQEGEVCAEASRTTLNQCPKKVGEPGAERIDETVIRGGVTREPPSLPWNVQFTDRIALGMQGQKWPGTT
jgi:IPT/TIG domain